MDTLPNELLLHVARFLKTPDVASFAMTFGRFRRLLGEVDNSRSCGGTMPIFMNDLNHFGCLQKLRRLVVNLGGGVEDKEGLGSGVSDFDLSETILIGFDLDTVGVSPACGAALMRDFDVGRTLAPGLLSKLTSVDLAIPAGVRRVGIDGCVLTNLTVRDADVVILGSCTIHRLTVKRVGDVGLYGCGGPCSPYDNVKVGIINARHVGCFEMFKTSSSSLNLVDVDRVSIEGPLRYTGPVGVSLDIRGSSIVSVKSMFDNLEAMNISDVGRVYVEDCTIVSGLASLGVIRSVSFRKVYHDSLSLVDVGHADVSQCSMGVIHMREVDVANVRDCHYLQCLQIESVNTVNVENCCRVDNLPMFANAKIATLENTSVRPGELRRFAGHFDANIVVASFTRNYLMEKCDSKGVYGVCVNDEEEGCRWIEPWAIPSALQVPFMTLPEEMCASVSVVDSEVGEGNLGVHYICDWWDRDNVIMFIVTHIVPLRSRFGPSQATMGAIEIAADLLSDEYGEWTRMCYKRVRVSRVELGW